MAYEPINYATLLPQPISPTAGLDAFQAEQTASAQRALAANQAQQQLRMQQLQNAALNDALTNPSYSTYRNYMLVNPQAAAAIKTAYDGLDTETQRQTLQDLTAVHGYLANGQPDQANAILDNYIKAHAKSGQDTTALKAIQSTIQSDPKRAQVLAGSLITAADPKAAEALGTTAGFQTEQDLKRAQTEQATAAANKDRFMTVGVDQSVIPLPGAPGAQPAPGAAPAQASPGDTRAARNNNPLNLTTLPQGQWAGQTGADGKFAVFATPEAGLAAADQNLQAYGAKHGINTVQGVIDRWAPQGDGANDPKAYAATVAADLGVQPGQKINLANPGVRQKLLASMAKVEAGGSSGGAPAQAGAPGQVQPIFQGPMANPQDAMLSPEAVDMAAFNYLRYGPSALQNLGQGKVGVLNKNRIMDRVAAMAKEAGTSNPELVASWAQNKANSEALTQNTKNLTQISASENTLNANLDFAMSLAKRGLGPTGIPLADLPINKLRASLGSADAKTLDNVLKTSADEYARILSGSPSGGGGTISDAARKQAEGLINNGMTLRQLTDAINAAKTEAANRRQAYVNENTRLTGEISGRVQTGQPTQSAPSQGGPVRVSSPAEAAKLAPGTQFVTPDGQVRVRH